MKIVNRHVPEPGESERCVVVESSHSNGVSLGQYPKLGNVEGE